MVNTTDEADAQRFVEESPKDPRTLPIESERTPYQRDRARLEAKVLAPDGASAGLNLTRASLDACCKYPWPASAGQRKFGVYADDTPVFAWLRSPVEGDLGQRRCLEAQVMDWADDVAYS